MILEGTMFVCASLCVYVCMICVCTQVPVRAFKAVSFVCSHAKASIHHFSLQRTTNILNIIMQIHKHTHTSTHARARAHTHMHTQYYTCSGLDRIALMVEKDHDLKIRSLLKYHMTGSYACAFVLKQFVGANVSLLK
jgi:hypothetical protein